MPARNAAPCVICRQPVEINESAISVCMYCRTVGIDDPLRSPQDQGYCCTECAVASVMGDGPSKNLALYQMMHSQVKYLIDRDPSIVLAAWIELQRRNGKNVLGLTEAMREIRKRLMLVAGAEPFAEGEILPPPKRLQAAAG